jgi:uncharacterized FlaG/YvyC family protein
METGIAIKSVTGVAVSDYARPASVPVQQAVPTELAAGRSVTASPAAAKADQDTQPSQGSLSRQLSSRDNLSRGYVIDPQTREVIFRVIDTRTRQVVRQVPDQALLRMHAYARALAHGDGALADLQTDISV